MKQSTTFLSLIQNLLSKEELTSILQEVGYEDTARTFDTRTFIEYLVTAAVSEWKSFRHGADVASDYGLPRVHYSTFSKKASIGALHSHEASLSPDCSKVQSYLQTSTEVSQTATSR